MPNPKLLIVDDHTENLSLIIDILRPYNYDLNVATSGAMALESLKHFHPDLILLDIVMPEMNGYAVLQAIKKDKTICDIPVVFLTAKDTTEEIIKGFEEGAVDYISKPFHPKEMIARVHTHLEKARLFSNLKSVMEHSFHELYTPLSIISSAMQMQEIEYKKSDYTQMTLAACKTLQTIYDDIYYSLEYSSKKRKQTVFDFTALLIQRIEYFKLVADSRFLQFKTVLPEKMNIQGNLQDMERVLDNLISNALKYTKENNEISISLLKNNGQWLFSICNPVAKKIDVEKIFKKYYRHNEHVFGLGIGLEMVQSICKSHGIDLNAVCSDDLFCIKMNLVEKK